MQASARLLRRFAGFFALAGAGLVLVLAAVAFQLEQHHLQKALEQQGRALAASMASALARPEAADPGAEPGSDPQALVSLAGALGAADLALVNERTGVVVAASRREWRGTAASALPPALRDASAKLHETPARQIYALSVPLLLPEPLAQAAAAAPGAYTLRLLLDGSRHSALNRQDLWTFALVTLGGLVLLGGVGYASLDRHVLNPLERIHASQGAMVRNSEERLQLAVAGSRDALFDYDPVHDRLYVSDTLKRWMYGADGRRSGGPGPERQTAVSGEELMRRIHPDHVMRIREAFRYCARTGRSFDLEFQVDRGGGQGPWLQARGRGVLQKHGLYRVSGFASDISRRKVAETLLHDTVDRLGAVLDNIAEGIFTLDGSGIVCTVNTAALRMYGLERHHFVGKPLTLMLELPARTGGWRELADGQPREARGLPVTRPPFPAEFGVSTMQVRSDERFIVVLRDISERKAVEDQLRRAMEKSQAATRAKDEFLATMSHEIRTPMNGVLGMTQLLLDMDLTRQQWETAQLIRSSGESLLTIINDILDFSRAGSGHLKVDAVAFDLRQAVREVVELLGRRHSAVHVYVDYPLELPARLVGDPGRVRQVLMNLVGNALKFTERGHVVVSVSARQPARPVAASDVAGDTARLEIAVEDTGPGIAEHARRMLFEPFTQADASTTRRFGGTGLGLAISRRLVELMGGEIGFDSEAGVGSVFRFSLDLPRQQPGESAPPRPALAGRRILVVSDDVPGRRIYAGCLERSGAETVAVGSGRAALASLEQGFDLAVVDHRSCSTDRAPRAQPLGSRAAGCAAGRALKQVWVCNDASGLAGEDAALLRSIVRPVMPEHLLGAVADLLGVDLDLERPAQVPEPRNDSRDRRLEASSAGEPCTAADSDVVAPAPGGGSRVLLAEDNLVNQMVAVRMLESAGCRTDVAANGVEALEMWSRNRYQVIFMDCQMPELDGLEATRRIRRQERTLDLPRTPIVAMTANALHSDRLACRAAGMDDYLSKPVDRDLLVRILARWTGPGLVHEAAG